MYVHIHIRILAQYHERSLWPSPSAFVHCNTCTRPAVVLAIQYIGLMLLLLYYFTGSEKSSKMRCRLQGTVNKPKSY